MNKLLVLGLFCVIGSSSVAMDYSQHEVGKLFKMIENFQNNHVAEMIKNNPTIVHACAKYHDPGRVCLIRATPLHVAAHKGNVDAVILLLNAAAECNVRADDQETPLWLANDKQTAEILIQHGAIRNCKNCSGQTLLYSTIFGTRRRLDIAECLIQYGEDINQRIDEQNNTFLHESVKDYDAPWTKTQFLLSHGADRTLRNREGKTASDRLFSSKNRAFAQNRDLKDLFK